MTILLPAPGRVAGLIYGSQAANQAAQQATEYAPANPAMLVPFFVANEYTHVVWVKQYTQYSFYRNGQAVGQAPAPQTVNMNNQCTCTAFALSYSL